MTVEVRPQQGPQEHFLSSPADLVVYGGAAGGGKTWAEVYEPLRHILPSVRWPKGVPGFSAVVFRRMSPQIRAEGGLWDESAKLYPLFGGEPRETIMEWRWPTGQTVRFASMQHEKDRLNWQGSQIPLIMFDELTHFSAEQFWYMMSRNRSTCGIRPYIRATTNPDADSWVADLVAWWIDQDESSETYGLPIPERSGVIRYFYRDGNTGTMLWGDEPEDLYDSLPDMPPEVNKRDLVKSFTFIAATVYDNKILLKTNPEYLANLMSQSLVERERLLGGNWKIKPSAGSVFNSAWWSGKHVRAYPQDLRLVRYWDKAGTDEKDTTAKTPWTVGLLLGKTSNNTYYVIDVKRAQLSAGKREKLIAQTALEDFERYGYAVRTWIEQEPGSGGKESAEITIRGLSGFHIKADRSHDSKIGRAMPASAQVEAGNVYVLDVNTDTNMDNRWVQGFIQELHSFPDARLKDQADALSGAFNKLSRLKSYDLATWPTSSR